MSERRRHRRFARRLQVEFSAGGRKFTGISSDFSEKGLFIRTRQAIPAGAYVDIKVFLPNGSTSTLKGVVRRTARAGADAAHNGVGVELIIRDEPYREFIKTLPE